MLNHMKRTTLILDDINFARVKSLAASENRTMSDLVNEFIRWAFVKRKEPPRKKLPPLFSRDCGGTLIPNLNFADRDELEEAMRED